MDERILQSARMEVDLRRTEAVLNLNKAYADMIQFPDTARLDPGRVHMVITITKPNEISEVPPTIALAYCGQCSFRTSPHC